MFQVEKIYTGWSGQRLLRHVCYWAAWLFFYPTLNSFYTEYSFGTWTLVELSVMCVKLPFTYFVIYYLVPQYLIKKRYLAFFLLTITFALIGGLLVSKIYEQFVCPYLFNRPYWSGKSMFYTVLDLIYVSSLPTVFKLLQRNLHQEKMTMQIAEQRLGAELKLLKNQLHPHFLFNTLNNLYGMVLTQHPKAADVVVRLSDMMSYMLYECEREAIDLEKEVANLSNYIELEKLRYGKRLDVSFETGGDIKGKTIAPLLLIPFLENAFKHGVEKSESNSWVVINLWVRDEQFVFSIENSVPTTTLENPQLPNTQSGIGLANVKKRLQLLYPDRHKLSIESGESYLVQLNLLLHDEMPNR
ncbi:MAG: histidine kinase [Bacteroidota bacterium]